MHILPVSSPDVEVRPTEHGLGVVSKRTMRPFTFIGVYPGQVYHEEEFEAQKKSIKEVKGEYAVDFYKLQPDGTIDEAWVLDPTLPTGQLDPKFARGAVAPFVNEPIVFKSWKKVGAKNKYRQVEPRHANPNLMWVFNLLKGTLEMYTYAWIEPNEELLICYGGKYTRTYTTSCQTARIEVHRQVIYGKDPRTGKPMFMWWEDFLKAPESPGVLRDIAEGRTPSVRIKTPPPNATLPKATRRKTTLKTTRRTNTPRINFQKSPSPKSPSPPQFPPITPSPILGKRKPRRSSYWDEFQTQFDKAFNKSLEQRPMSNNNNTYYRNTKRSRRPTPNVLRPAPNVLRPAPNLHRPAPNIAPNIAPNVARAINAIVNNGRNRCPGCGALPIVKSFKTGRPSVDNLAKFQAEVTRNFFMRHQAQSLRNIRRYHGYHESRLSRAAKNLKVKLRPSGWLTRAQKQAQQH